MDKGYRKWAEVSREALVHNYEVVRARIEPSTKIMAIVKADGYGHGSVECAKVFMEQGAAYLGVSSMGEALVLRRFGIDAPILVLGYVDETNLEACLEANLTFACYSLEFAEKVNRLGKAAKIHIKIDTGMNRLGFQCEAGTVDAIQRISRMENIEIEGIFSHFACESVEDNRGQYEAFCGMISELEERGIDVGMRHICNSWACLNTPEFQMDMVRVGLALYGYGDERLRPVMEFKTIVIHNKKVPKGRGISYGWRYKTAGDEWIATIPIGYADGFSRVMSGKAETLVRGERKPVVGAICMDMCMVRVDEDLAAGEVVTVFGEGLPATELAEWNGTIVYEILTRIGKRVPRVMVG